MLLALGAVIVGLFLRRSDVAGIAVAGAGAAAADQGERVA
jgi:hypothetical protein